MKRRFDTVDEWLEWQQTVHPLNIDFKLERILSVYKKLDVPKVANKIIFEIAKVIDKERPESKSHCSLKDGLITQKENIPNFTKEKLKIFTDSYWS